MGDALKQEATRILSEALPLVLVALSQNEANWKLTINGNQNRTSCGMSLETTRSKKIPISPIDLGSPTTK